MVARDPGVRVVPNLGLTALKRRGQGLVVGVQWTSESQVNTPLTQRRVVLNTSPAPKQHYCNLGGLDPDTPQLPTEEGLGTTRCNTIKNEVGESRLIMPRGFHPWRSLYVCI